MRKTIRKILITLLMVIITLMINLICFVNISYGYSQVTKDANNKNKNGINEFPDSYKMMLNKLVNDTGHTNWKFKAMYTGIDWNKLVENETSCLHNTIYMTSSYPKEWYDGCGKHGDRGYYCASKEITEYFLDCRNFITEQAIFQFLDQSNGAKVSVEDIANAVSGTWLSGSVDEQSYAQMIYDAAKESGMSAYSIITKIFQEIGPGSQIPYMVSGTSATYPNCYNFINYGASDGDGNLERGLAFASSQGWNSPRTALIGGAKILAKEWINSGQVNQYLFKFDVVGSSDSSLFWHQYATNVEDANNQSNILFKLYNNYDLLNDSLTFVIPVYDNMPSFVKLPPVTTSSNMYFVSSKYTGVTFRSGASSSSSSIGSLRKDSVVQMLEENAGNGYSKISYNGKEGYMSKAYLTKVWSQEEKKKETNTQEVVTNRNGKEFLGKAYDSSKLISYSAHLQDIGWTQWESDGNTIGTNDEFRRIETLKIKLGGDLVKSKVNYQAHVQGIGWQNWVTNGEEAGTLGKGLRLEGFKIKLDNSNYTLKYRAFVQGIGWQNWVTDGETAGTIGKSLRIEAIEIKVEKKNNNITGVSYISQVQALGWLNWIKDGDTSGTTGQFLRLESLKIKLNGTINIKDAIQYQAHVQGIGWQNWVSDGETAGTVGQCLRLEAIKIKLNDNLKSLGKHLKYRAHVQGIGWQDWVSDGEIAGTVGQCLRVEAIQIKIE